MNQFRQVFMVLFVSMLSILFSFVSLAQAPQDSYSGIDEASDQLFSQARFAVQSLRDSGFSVSTLDSNMARMDSLIESGDLGSARVLAGSVMDSSLDAQRAMVSIRTAQETIRQGESRWIDMGRSRSLVGLSLAALQREQYSVALDRAGQAVTVSHVEASRVGWRWLLAVYWWAWSILLVLLFAAVFMGVRSRKAFFISRRIKALEAEDANILKSISDAYKRRYGAHEISGSVFHKEMFHYLHRQRVIREERLRLRSRRAAVLGVDSEMKDLERERSAIEAVAGKAQEAHLVKMTMSEQEYHALAQEYHERLAEIEEAIGVLKESSASNGRKAASGLKSKDTCASSSGSLSDKVSQEIGRFFGHIAAFFLKGFKSVNGRRRS